MAVPPPDCGKTPSDHSQRRTAVNAAENVTASLPGQPIRPVRCEDALVVGAVARGEWPEGSQEVSDGAAAGGKQGGGQQRDEPLEGGLGKGGCAGGQERGRFGG